MNQQYVDDWAEKDYQFYLSRDYTPEEARAKVDKLAAMIPNDVDPAKWVPKPADFDRVEKMSIEDMVADAQRTWAETAPEEFEQVLDAGEGDPENA